MPAKQQHANGPSEEQHCTSCDGVCQEIPGYCLGYLLAHCGCWWEEPRSSCELVLVAGIRLAQCIVPLWAQLNRPLGFTVLSCYRETKSMLRLCVLKFAVLRLSWIINVLNVKLFHHRFQKTYFSFSWCCIWTCRNENSSFSRSVCVDWVANSRNFNPTVNL